MVSLHYDQELLLIKREHKGGKRDKPQTGRTQLQYTEIKQNWMLSKIQKWGNDTGMVGKRCTSGFHRRENMKRRQKRSIANE